MTSDIAIHDHLGWRPRWAFTFGVIGIVLGSVFCLGGILWAAVNPSRLFPEWMWLLAAPLIAPSFAGILVLRSFVRRGGRPAFGWGLALILFAGLGSFEVVGSVVNWLSWGKG